MSLRFGSDRGVRPRPGCVLRTAGARVSDPRPAEVEGGLPCHSKRSLPALPPSSSPALNPCEWGAVSRLAKPSRSDARRAARKRNETIVRLLGGCLTFAPTATRTRDLPLRRSFGAGADCRFLVSAVCWCLAPASVPGFCPFGHAEGTGWILVALVLVVQVPKRVVTTCQVHAHCAASWTVAARA